MAPNVHVLVKHPDRNEFLVALDSKKLLCGSLQDGEHDAAGVARILQDYNVYANKPVPVELVHVGDSLLGPDDETLYYEVDVSYCYGLPPDRGQDVPPASTSKAAWLPAAELTDYQDVLQKLAHEPVKNPDELLKSIKAHMSHLDKLLDDISGHWTYEDYIYRFYHQSFKVYYLQATTRNIVHWFNRVGHGADLNGWFKEIVAEGTGHKFEMDHNREWLKHTRPICEAFFHAKYFLEMMIKYGKELDGDVQCMPSGYAALLYLYNMR
jgi:hypothetical protein